MQDFGLAPKPFRADNSGVHVANAIPASLAERIDLLGELRRRIQEFKPVVKQEKELTDLLLARAANWKPDQEGEDDGAMYLMRMSRASEEQHVKNWPKVYLFLGARLFVKLAKITFELLKVHLTAEQYAEVVEKRRTGPRKLELA